MPEFGKESKENLATCHPEIQRLFNEIIKHVDCKVLEGHRTLARQKDLVAQGKSKTMNSKHCTSPSLAVDVAPYPINWNDRERFIYFAGIVKGIAVQLGIPIRWGGDWDMDMDLLENRFDDLVHFELVISELVI